MGLAVGDFNGDGKPDFAITDTKDKRVVVYLNTGNGSFSSPISTSLQFSAQGAYTMVTGDFNEDGKQDVIVSTIGSPLTDIFLSGNGDGTFAQQSNLSGSNGFEGGVAVDINHDSHLDFIAGESGLYIYLGDGHGNFQLNPFSNPNSGGNYTSVVAADFNKDQEIDFAAAAWLADLRSFLGAGDGTFSGPNSLSSPEIQNPFSLATADFNGDGNPDLLLGSLNAAFVILGNGDGTFRLNSSDLHPVAFPNTHPVGGQNLLLVVATDADLDGKVDAIVADNASKTVNVVLNDGTGTFPQANPDFSAPIDAGTTQMQVADFNGDGLPDIILTNYVTGNVSIFYSKAPPTFTLTPSADPQFVNSPLSFTAKLTGTNNTIPTGTVTLMDGTNSLGQQTLDSNGQAVFSVSNLAAGRHSLTVSYSGDSNYLTASSSSFTEAITDFQISLNASSQTVLAGGMANYSFTLTPIAGLTGPLVVTCSQLPSLTTCDPLTVSLNGQPSTTTLVVHTTAPVQSRYRSIQAAGIGLITFAFATFLPWHRRTYLRLLTTILAVILIGFTVGCSGGSKAPTTIKPGTPSGSAAFTITSSITVGGQTLTHTTNATLVVQ
jgi:Bacterial Ig-like domain (group 3)/FG-GAP-like repeat